ncbi:MAG: pyruvate, water dikinase regulatory protein [Rhodospirillales bacterium]
MNETEKRTIVLYLVSHASGELVEMLARNAVAQFERVEVERRLWKMVRSLGQVPDILATIGERRGFVVHSISDETIRQALEEGCYALRVPCLFALDPLVGTLAAHYDLPIHFRSSARDVMDDDYFRRVEAMKYTLAHDDGVAADYLDDADVILIGVSRATKTPTCMYLASRGIKAANVPLVPGVPLPDGVLQAKQPLIVGLTINPEHLAKVREGRLKRLHEDDATDYAELDAVMLEVREARRLYSRHGWRVIDVTQRSIEQTAAYIIHLLEKHRGQAAEPQLPPPDKADGG